jgi:uncharacterized membrane protein
VAVLGLVGYGAILVTTAFRGLTAATVCVALAAFALVFAAWLLVAQLALIHAICQWCVASDVVITLLTAAALMRYLLAFPRAGDARALAGDAL